MTGRDRMVVIVVAVVGAIAAAWLLVVSPERNKADQLGQQVATAQSTLSAAQAQLAQGEAARTAFRSSYATMVRLGGAVPTDDDVPSLIYEIQSAAGAAQVDFQGLTLAPGSTPGGPQGSSSTTTPAPSPTTSSPTATLPPGVSVGPAGFPVEPFTFTFRGNFFHLASFFGRLERFVQATQKRVAVSGRLMTLDAIDLTPSPSGFPQIDATVSATTFLLPSSQGLLAGATPAGPAPSSPQPAAATPSPSSSGPPAAAVTGAPVR